MKYVIFQSSIINYFIMIYLHRHMYLHLFCQSTFLVTYFNNSKVFCFQRNLFILFKLYFLKKAALCVICTSSIFTDNPNYQKSGNIIISVFVDPSIFGTYFLKISYILDNYPKILHILCCKFILLLLPIFSEINFLFKSCIIPLYLYELLLSMFTMTGLS